MNSFEHEFLRRSVATKVFLTSQLDIALIELEKGVMRDDLVSPACVSTIFSEIVTDEYCAALGWGKRGEFEDLSTVLKTVSVNLMSK